MLQIQAFGFNPFQENTYLLINEEKQCWIVDPGMYDSTETKQLEDFISTHGLAPQAIINTHTHIDHILGVQAAKDRYKIPFLVHKDDMPVLINAMVAAARFGIRLDSVPEADGFIDEQQPLQLGKDILTVKLVPGHSPGSVAFYSADGHWLLGGDVLFRQSIGRTDLPGGHHETLLRSIREQLFVLPDDTVVFPGHGPHTTIGFEKANNPFLQ